MSRSFVDHVAWAQDGEAAVADERDRLSYRQLRDASGVIAGEVRRRFGTGRYLLLRSRADVTFVSTLLGIMWSGNTPVPIDSQSPPDVIAYMRRKVGTDDVLDPIDPSQCAREGATYDADATMPAFVVFTSGTSGNPKGVIVSNENILHSCGAISQYLSYETYNSAAVVLPLHYSYALLSQICCMLLMGGFARIYPGCRNPVKLARSITEAGLSTFCGVPSTYYAFSQVHQLSPIEFPTIRVLCTAGAPMDVARYATIKEMFPNSVVYNNYGMTEAAPRISFVRDDDSRFFDATCGKPMAGVNVKVIDPESHLPLPDGATGVLAVRGPNITTGYLNDEGQTKLAFTRDGYLISGDLAYLQDGYIMLLGRSDDMFNVGGEKVAPIEIERVLTQLPGVVGAAVRGCPDEQRGMVPIAFIHFGECEPERSRAWFQWHLKGRLTASKTPHRFFEVRSFPLNGNGKIVRRMLAMNDPSYVIKEIL